MLFIPQLRRQGCLLYFAPSTTRVHRIGRSVLIVQNNESYVSSYIVDLTGKEAEQFHVKYVPSVRPQNDVEDPVAPRGGIVHVCLYETSFRGDRKPLSAYRLAVLLRDQLVVLNLSLQTVDSFHLEHAPALSVLAGCGYLLVVCSTCFTVFDANHKAFTAYYLTASAISTSRPVIPFGGRAEVLSCTLCGAVPICIIRCDGLLKVFLGDRVVKSLKAMSRPERYTACNGKVFRIRKRQIDVYGVGTSLVLENTLKAQEGSGACFVDVFSTYSGRTVIRMCSGGVFSNYLYEDGTRWPASYEVAAELQSFSVVEKEGSILLKVDEQEHIENPEDLNEVDSYLLLANPMDDRLFHRTVMFVLFKRLMRKEYASSGSVLCKELSCFSMRILSVFDCVDLIDCDVEKHLRGLVSEKTLIDCLMLDFRTVSYPFMQYKNAYSLLLAVHTSDDIPEDCKGVILSGAMQRAVLEIAMRRGKHSILLSLVDEASIDRSIVDFLMGIPAKCHQNKKKLVQVLVGFASGSSHPHYAEQIVDYLYGFYQLICPETLKDSRELQYRMYRRLLDRLSTAPDAAEFDTAPMHLLLSVGRKDLGCILGYSLYSYSQGTLRDEERQEVLERVRENIGDYVFVFDGRFVGRETLLLGPSSPLC